MPEIEQKLIKAHLRDDEDPAKQEIIRHWEKELVWLEGNTKLDRQAFQRMEVKQ